MTSLMILALALGTVAIGAGPQETLNAAKDLYASAAYEDALSTLASVDAGSATPDISRQVNQYRAFCLYALGRTAEAESVAESLIQKDPLMQLDLADTSPRLQAMFTRTRTRLLPGLIRDKYRTVKVSLDRKDYAAAEPYLIDLRQMLGDAQTAGAWDEGLADLRVLVDGFLDLSRAKSEQSARPVAGRVDVPPDAKAAAAALSNAPAPDPVKGRRIFTAGDQNLVEPVALDQRMPTLPQQLEAIMNRSHRRGTLEVLIDEHGAVETAVIKDSINPTYDQLLIAAARRWRYRPAMQNGTPVRYAKTILVVAQGQSQD
jgi:tetratricopeptide (TPR) repeat protein